LIAVAGFEMHQPSSVWKTPLWKGWPWLALALAGLTRDGIAATDAMMQFTGADWLPASTLAVLVLGATSAVTAMKMTVLQRQLSRERTQRLSLERHFQALATLDGLTGLPNRHAFLETAAISLAEATFHDQPLSLLRIDIDQFHLINDRLGQNEGDACLLGLCTAMRDHVGDNDLLARLGGDEFALLLRQTDMTDAADRAEKIRAGAAIAHGDQGAGITISIGIASRCANGNFDLLMAQAGQAMANAKRMGGNQVALASLPDEAAYSLHRKG
jgi:diguanylate cyclase (GGDEF)-like protein